MSPPPGMGVRASVAACSSAWRCTRAGTWRRAELSRRMRPRAAAVPHRAADLAHYTRRMNRHVSLALATAAAVAVLAADAGPAHANIAAPPPPSRVSGIAPAADNAGLVVISADLVVDCTDGQPGCGLQVTYALHNPAEVSLGGTAAFYSIDTDDVRVTLDGQASAHELTAAEAAGFDAAVAAASGAPPEDVNRSGFQVTLPPGGRGQVVVTGRLHRQPGRGYYMAVPGPAARHRLLRRGAPNPATVRLDYLVAPIRTWARFPERMTFTLRAPAGWSSSLDGVDGATTERAGAIATTRGTIATTTASIHLHLTLPRVTPIHAGLVLGVGGHVDNATGLRLRGGVEAGVAEVYLGSIAVELERGDAPGVVIVPAVALSSPWVIVVPSFAIGLGVPVRVSPDLDIGGRFLLDAHFGPLGMMMALDYYPGMDTDPRRFQVALLGQVAL